MDIALRAAAELLARQDGLATVDQLVLLGLTRGAIRGRIKAGEWVKLSRRVIASRATAWSWRRTVRAAWLDAGGDAAVSHSTAARFHGFDGFDRDDEVHLTICGGVRRTSLTGVNVHRSQLLDESACPIVDGIRVVSKPVALLQIAGTRGVDAAARALDGMLRSGDSPVWIDQVVRRWQRPAVKGASLVLALLHERVHHRLPRSWFQRIAKRVLRSRGMMLEDEYPVVDPATGRRIAELDLAQPELRIGIECQSWEWHGSPGAQARDARRKRRLRLLGWELIEVWWTDLRRIEEVITELEYLIDRKVPRLLS